MSLYDIQYPTMGNEDVEPTVMERTINFKSTYPLASFSWHPHDENRIMTCSGSNALGKSKLQIKVVTPTIFRVILHE